MRLGHFRFQRDRPLIAGGGFVKTIQGAQRNAAVVEDNRGIRDDPRRKVELSQGPQVLAPLEVHHAEQCRAAK